jgi:hypothetical protein
VLSRDQLLMRTRNREWEPFDRARDNYFYARTTVGATS